MMPFRPKTTNKLAIKAIIFIWLIAIITPLPILVVQTVHNNSPDNSTQCDEIWFGNRTQQERSRLAFTWVLAILSYLFPLIVLLLSYFAIGAKIWFSRVPGEMVQSVDTKRRNSTRKVTDKI